MGMIAFTLSVKLYNMDIDDSGKCSFQNTKSLSCAVALPRPRPCLDDADNSWLRILCDPSNKGSKHE